jgi:alpha-beta hydrolase superfamily lysophospholipase
VPDARVQAAIDHWAPRFVQAGVDYSDFVVTTAGVERWEEWHAAWCRNGDMHAGLAEEPAAKGNLLTAGEAWARATVGYHFAKFVWMVDPGLSRAAADKAVAAMAKTHEYLDPDAERLEVPLDGGRVVGNLRRPDGQARPPLVLLVPGLDSTKEEFFKLENVFLERGMATLSMDGPGQGESGYELHIHANYEVAVTAMLDALAGRDDIDHERIGTAGVSMGGYYAPRAAAFEPRIRAQAGISGPYDMSFNWDNLPSLTRETFQHHVGASSPEEAREKAAELDLTGVAERIDVPSLVITGKLDRLIPWEQTKMIADAAPNGEFVMWDEGNHVCNNIPYKYRPLTADWLSEKLA